MLTYPNKYDLKKLLELHDEGWLKMSKYKDQLYIFCYAPKAQYEKNWTYETLAMRGMVLGREGEVIGPCLPKFFNLAEVEATKPWNLPKDEPYEIFEKLDGSYLTTFFNPYENKWQHATKCSFDNEYIDAAYKFLSPAQLDVFLPLTNLALTSEIRVDNDPMRRVTDCDPGLYGITSWRLDFDECLELDWDVTQYLYAILGLKTVKKFDSSLEHHLDTFAHDKDTEGYVVKFKNGLRTKLKTTWYLQLNRLLEDFSPTKTRQTIKDYLVGNDFTLDWVKYLPDELWEEAETQAASIMEDYNAALKVVDELHMKLYNEDKKTFAMNIQGCSPLVRSALFAKNNGKDYKKFIWESV